LAARPGRFLLGPCGFWGDATGPNPTDRAKNGSKRHLLTDGRGTPLAITHTGANSHDSNQALALVDAIPPIKRSVGRPRRRPDPLYAARAYDAEAKIRRPLRRRGIEPKIARRRAGHGSGWGRLRWYVEATAAWLMLFRRLRGRYEKRDDIHQAFLILGCVLICWNKVLRFC
jgi:transposase